jgi:hypothetical protein
MASRGIRTFRVRSFGSAAVEHVVTRAFPAIDWRYPGVGYGIIDLRICREQACPPRIEASSRGEESRMRWVAHAGADVIEVVSLGQQAALHAAAQIEGVSWVSVVPGFRYWDRLNLRVYGIVGAHRELERAISGLSPRDWARRYRIDNRRL